VAHRFPGIFEQLSDSAAALGVRASHISPSYVSTTRKSHAQLLYNLCRSPGDALVSLTMIVRTYVEVNVILTVIPPDYFGICDETGCVLFFPSLKPGSLIHLCKQPALEITACAFRSSADDVALISDDITLRR